MFKKPIRSLSILPFLAALLLLTSAPTFASQLTANQQPEQASQNQQEIRQVLMIDTPFFPGGEAQLIKYISDNIQYPVKALQNGIQGRVFVQFFIDNEGNVADANIVRGKDPELGEEALRVVRSLPPFRPGKVNDVSHESRGMLKINFILPEGSDSIQQPTIEVATGDWFVDETPEFPGGEVELYKFLSMNVRYPENAAKNLAEGCIEVCFVVEADGTIGEIKGVRAVDNPEEASGRQPYNQYTINSLQVMGRKPQKVDPAKVRKSAHGVDPDLAAEAVRLVLSLPQFTPAKVNGNPVRVWCTLPIDFRLQE